MEQNINLNLYKIFYVCAKSKSFVDASQKLCVSQPSVSKHIKNLEEQLNIKLFYRDKKGLSLTEEGMQLFNYIDKSYNYLIAGEKILKERNNIDYGKIVIGAPAHIASFYLLRFIENYREKHPNVYFKIINGSTSELIKALKNHELDFVIDSSPIDIDDTDINIDYLTSFETCLITNNKSNTSFDFKDMKYIMPYKRSNIRKNLERELIKNDIKLNVVLEVETTDLIISSVKNGIGSGYVVKKAVEKELKNHEIIELKTEFELPKLELNLVYIDDYLAKLPKYFIKNYIKLK